MIRKAEHSSVFFMIIFFYHFPHQEKKNILKEVMRYHINDIFSNVQDEISNKRYVEDKLYAKGKQHVEDYLQYGAMTSIDWSYKNWGTQGHKNSQNT